MHYFFLFVVSYDFEKKWYLIYLWFQIVNFYIYFHHERSLPKTMITNDK